ncbi:MAG: ABC transporter ATP-binding protein, partial [Proteobacteria bacterium]|nr:ABC transporter ATP-binding protein [Pseudomonadota bacterium]
RLLTARRTFAAELPAALESSVEFFDAGKYNAAASLQDNILFGKVAYGQALSAERVGAMISEVVDQLGLRDEVMEVGLDYEVGIGGARLGIAQRQSLAIARSLLKRPDLMIVNEALTVLDDAVQTRILRNLIAEMKGRGLIFVSPRAKLAKDFGRVVVMESGKIVEQGTFTELDREGTRLSELLRAG